MKSIVEVLLFATSDPLTQAKLNACLQDDSTDLDEIIRELNEEYEKSEKGIYIGKIAGGYQILSKPEYHLYIQRLYNKIKKLHLSHAATEALTVIAYRQPVSRAELENIRGVNCDSVVRTLMEKELVTIKGREDGMGRAILYGTTLTFLEAFGLNSITDLPQLKEIKELVESEETPIGNTDETK